MTRALAHIEQDAIERPASRIRASENAIRAALKALRDAGLPVDKVCVSGAKVEIHCGHVERVVSDEKDGGLEEW